MEHASKSNNIARSSTATDTRVDIRDFSKEELVAWLSDHDIAPYRADQIFKWIYQHQADDFSAMTNISKPIRELLDRHFTISRLAIAKAQVSADGTRKYLFTLAAGNHIESVLIPEDGHDTLCISTQVGCAQGCRFCLTAASGFTRNLTPGEITGQILEVGRTLDKARRLTNIVLMGMGEPLANFGAVLTALKIITDGDDGMKFSTRRVTLSTSGIVPKIALLGRETKINLAVSLNATDNRTRDFLMPVNKTYPIESLLAACAAYPLSHRQKITVEYILIKGVNDSEADVARLIRLLRPLKAKINLIPFNEHRQSSFKRPDDSVIDRFKQALHDHHYTVMTRLSKGADISAACGQLSADIGQYGS
ncbi:MAG: 23S rRNA (adenine(2503)-C(2))-methyltransferase RlmN [Thermodesulfobacteriota bacterium]